jgi:N-acetyl-anhydromuramyl-L-alanine amidase AmpD
MEAIIEGEGFISGLGARIGGLIDHFTGCRIEDRTALSPKVKRKSTRNIDNVYALVLHQMAFSRGSDPKKYDKVTAHFTILPDGNITQLHPVTAYLYASNGFNKCSVAVEFAGNFPSTRGMCWRPESFGCHQLTNAQITSGRCLIRHLIRTIGLTHVLTHRQSSGPKSNDPGPDIWYHVGQWAVDNLGMKDGGPGFKIGGGNPIPDEWRNWGKANPR